MKRGDWCSEVPIKRVAADCHLDVSTVTRAYQLLAKLGCLKRTDPGRDPANPFQQATALTEVRLPRALLAELDRHPNRRTAASAAAADPEPPRMPEAPATLENKPADDPFAGLSGRDRLRMLAALTRSMSAAERTGYDEARRIHRTHMSFDVDTKLSAEERGRVLQQPSVLAASSRRGAASAPGSDGRHRTGARPPARCRCSRLARLRRDGQATAPVAAAAELLRQVVWSIEEGSLRRFSPAHAAHIALKKIREGAWTRPNRMPPQWVRALSAPSLPEELLQPCITKKGSLRDLFTEDYSNGRRPVG